MRTVGGMRLFLKYPQQITKIIYKLKIYLGYKIFLVNRFLLREKYFINNTYGSEFLLRLQLFDKYN
jgi:hypothetical protein